MTRPCLLAAAGLIFTLWLPAPSMAETPQPTPQSLAPNVWLIAGGIPPGRQPDGNTVIFNAPHGLVVMDTGRHAWQQQAILDFARSRGRPIVAIVNSHWHLDHISGNRALRRAYPGIKIYASTAIEAALTGFLARGVEDGRIRLAAGDLTPALRDDIAGDIATVTAGEALRPDVVVTRSKTHRLAGRPMRLNLARHAATAGDVWLYDPQTRIVAAGDLVTLPAPFLDTACPEGWQAALDQVMATPFRLLVPGHGPPMSREQVALYRDAFSALLTCAGSSDTEPACAARWVESVRPLLDPAAPDLERAQRMTAYYVAETLRPSDTANTNCAKA